MQNQNYQIAAQIFGKLTKLPTIYTNFDEAIVACMEANDAFTRNGLKEKYSIVMATA